MTFYGGWLLAVVAGVDGLAWLRWREAVETHRAPTPSPPANLDASTAALVGPTRAAAERRSAWANVSREKAPGVLRIGCFGDSFTWGDEVTDGNDYPAWLQLLLDRDAGPAAQVLNFGSTGYGFHQSALLWERLGLDYRLTIGWTIG